MATEVSTIGLQGNRPTEKNADLSCQEAPVWFVMRDLKRPNAKLPAHKQLSEMGFEVFTPMKQLITVRAGRRIRQEVPVIPDLLFVCSTRGSLDPVVARTSTLQYRFMKGSAYCCPMTVRHSDMQRFITAVESTESPVYYQPSELKPEMIGRKIRIVGGSLDGYEGSLLSLRGSRKRRLIVEIPGLMAVGVEINPDYIQFIN
jgi:hypothetical protein